MRTWTLPACLLLASIITAVLAMTVGMTARATPAQAGTCTTITTASSTPAAGRAGHPSPAPSTSATAFPAFTTTTATATAAAAGPVSERRYVVRAGDTLAGIAARLGVPGGWPALYAANRDAIGSDPDLIRVGLVLAVPAAGTVPARYTVTAGDTLAGIAARLGVPGGWPALYAANRHAIGPDPDLIRAGLVLTIPATPPPAPPGHTRPAAPVPPRPAPAPVPAPSHPAPAPSRPAAGQHQAARPVTGMLSWLTLTLLAAGLLTLAGLAAEPARTRHRRRPGTTPSTGAGPAPAPAPAPDQPGEAAPPGIVFADHDKLVITRNTRDDSICVLRPAGEDPRAILRVARLILPEPRYGELARQLGLPARWPME
jgi:LysM repeat protein